MRILVCGGRDFVDRDFVYQMLDGIAEGVDQISVIHGNARGVDRLADDWAMGKHETVVFSADWGTHGKAAGPIRNQQMLDEGKPDIVVAFPGGRGTADMIRRAKRDGVQIVKYVARLGSSQE